MNENINNMFDELNRQLELLNEDKPESDGFIKINKVYKLKIEKV
mgnify:CR=1 FL=1|jgi:hypothetical protein|nr:MAG TPA: Protein of unknown function (DUF2538) [Caudoviricetes sp.]